jgi:hypothetical protein
MEKYVNISYNLNKVSSLSKAYMEGMITNAKENENISKVIRNNYS